MASASDFLKKRTAARQQAESIQSSDKTPLGKNDDGTVTRASNFLRNKAAERRAVIDQQARPGGRCVRQTGEQFGVIGAAELTVAGCP